MLRPSDQVEVLDVGEVGHRLKLMLPPAREVLAIMYPSRPVPSLSAASHELLVAALRHGVAIRSLNTAELVTNPACGRFISEATDAGIDVRTLPDLPTWLVVIDKTAVMLPQDPEDPGCGVVLLRVPGAVAIVTWAFDQAWWRARPTPPPQLTLTSQDHQVLKCLSAGLKDDLAARQLRVSVRTYRRYVTKLCKQLDASSRFEAGAKAALQGLVLWHVMS
jgi:DNA-binding CsgD family transcriptional regulator